MPTAELTAPEASINPPVAPTVVENPDSATPSLEDSQKIEGDKQELAGFLNHTETQPVEKVVHEGETILAAHTVQIDGNNILLPGESAQDFKADLDAPIDEKKHWFAVWVERLAKIWHKAITFGKTSQG